MIMSNEKKLYKDFFPTEESMKDILCEEAKELIEIMKKKGENFNLPDLTGIFPRDWEKE